MPGTCIFQDGRPGQNPGSFQLLWAHCWCLHCLSGDHHGWVSDQSDHSQGPPPVLTTISPFPSAFPSFYIKASSLSLSPSHLRPAHRCGCLQCFLVSQCPQLILPGGSIPCRSVAQHCHCAQACVPQSCPCPQETELYPSTAIHQLFPSSSLSISVSLLQIWTRGFLHNPPAHSLSPSRWKRHCKYIPLHCLVFNLV